MISTRRIKETSQTRHWSRDCSAGSLQWNQKDKASDQLNGLLACTLAQLRIRSNRPVSASTAFAQQIWITRVRNVQTQSATTRTRIVGCFSKESAIDPIVEVAQVVSARTVCKLGSLGSLNRQPCQDFDAFVGKSSYLTRTTSGADPETSTSQQMNIKLAFCCTPCVP